MGITVVLADRTIAMRCRESNDESGVTMEKQGRGWILFSMIVLLTAGIMRVFDGIWMIHNSNVATGLQLSGSLWGTSLKTYGWIYLCVGIVLILTALALASGAEWARWVGIFAGAILAITACWWLPIYAIWALVYIGIGIGVIYGLAAYGGNPEVADSPDPVGSHVAAE